MTTPDRPTDTPDAAAERLAECRVDVLCMKWADAREMLDTDHCDRRDKARSLMLAIVAELERRIRAAGTPDAGAVAELVEASLNYDAAVLRHAIKGKSWVAGDDLDALYATWIGAARRMKERLLNQRPARTPDPSPAGSVDVCEAVGPHHGDRCNRGRIQSPNAQFTQPCGVCGGTGRKSAPDPSPVGEADLAAERLSDLVAYDPDLKLVLAELPRLRAALARVEGEADLYCRGYSAMRAADISEYLALCGSVREMQRNLDEARQQLAAVEAKLAEVTKERDEQSEYNPYPKDTALLGEFAPQARTVLDLIRLLVTVHKRFGNTRVTFKMSWGSSALWARDELQKELDASEEKRRAAEAREAELREALRAFTKFNCEWEYDSARPEDWLHGWALKDDLQRAEKLVLNLAAPAGPGEAGKETP